MYKKILTVCVLLIFFLTPSHASNIEAYVDGSKPFIKIKNVNRQGEAWAVCAAAYDVMSGLFKKTHPAQSQKMSEFGNGAELAIMMTLVNDEMKKDISRAKFQSVLKYAQIAGTEWPKLSMTTILADRETLGTKGRKVFLEKITLTTKVCLNNIEAQQMYIDSWRALAKSGLIILK